MEWFADLQEDTDVPTAATSKHPVSVQSADHFGHWDEDQFNEGATCATQSVRGDNRCR